MGDVNDITDADLIRRVIAGCAFFKARSARANVKPLWHVVGQRFNLGSTYAAQLCRRFGYDPDQMVRP